ncbi:Ig-like domain-containing protein [Streptomyces tricolor]|nr:Ig-like domain-containing protein [Streptomyces tricolor]
MGGALGEPPAPQDVIRVTPDDGSRGVRPDQPLRVRVPGGAPGEGDRGSSRRTRGSPAVPGHVGADGLTWRPDEDRLALAAQYTVDVVALDPHRRRRAARHTTFTTYVPDQRFIAYVSPENRATVGTGMIVSLSFSQEIADQAAVERAVRVSARPPVEIRPHWFGKGPPGLPPGALPGKPGTEVTVDLDLRDVEGAPGIYGLQDKTVSFTVGRSQVSLVDAAKHTMQVRRDGHLLATVPITAGAPKHPTYNGKMVVMDMLEVTRMNSQIGLGAEYDIPDVPHAISSPTPAPSCRQLLPRRPRVQRQHAAWGWGRKGGGAAPRAGSSTATLGDIVEVVHSKDKTVAPDNGLGGWNMGWNSGNRAAR